MELQPLAGVASSSLSSHTPFLEMAEFALSPKPITFYPTSSRPSLDRPRLSCCCLFPRPRGQARKCLARRALHLDETSTQADQSSAPGKPDHRKRLLASAADSEDADKDEVKEEEKEEEEEDDDDDDDDDNGPFLQRLVRSSQGVSQSLDVSSEASKPPASSRKTICKHLVVDKDEDDAFLDRLVRSCQGASGSLDLPSEAEKSTSSWKVNRKHLLVDSKDVDKNEDDDAFLSRFVQASQGVSQSLGPAMEVANRKGLLVNNKDKVKKEVDDLFLSRLLRSLQGHGGSLDPSTLQAHDGAKDLSTTDTSNAHQSLKPLFVPAIESLKKYFLAKGVKWGLKLSFPKSPRTRGIILLNLLTFLYGSNIPVIKQVEKLLDPSVMSVGRFAIATLAFSPFILQELENKEVYSAGIELGLWASIGYITQGISLLTTDAGRAAFLSAFTVIVVPFLASLSGKRISKLTWAASAASLLGVALLESSGPSVSFGDIWCLVSAVSFGIHMLRSEHYSRRIAADKTFSLIGFQLLVITLSSCVWWSTSNVMVHGIPSIHRIDWDLLRQGFCHLPLLPMVYTGVISTALCLWIEMSSMRSVSATEAALVYSLEPLWGASIAWCILGERWDAQGWLGALLILGGSVTVQAFGCKES